MLLQKIYNYFYKKHHILFFFEDEEIIIILLEKNNKIYNYKESYNYKLSQRTTYTVSGLPFFIKDLFEQYNIKNPIISFIINNSDIKQIISSNENSKLTTEKNSLIISAILGKDKYYHAKIPCDLFIQYQILSTLIPHNKIIIHTKIEALLSAQSYIALKQITFKSKNINDLYSEIVDLIIPDDITKKIYRLIPNFPSKDFEHNIILIGSLSLGTELEKVT